MDGDHPINQIDEQKKKKRNFQKNKLDKLICYKEDDLSQSNATIIDRNRLDC